MSRGIVCVASILLMFFSSRSLYAWNLVGDGAGVGGFWVEVNVYSRFPVDRASELLLRMKFDRAEVEFDIENPDITGAFCLSDVALQKASGGGFVIRATDGNYKENTWFYAPYPVNRGQGEGEKAWCFDNHYSYRMTLYRVVDNAIRKDSGTDPFRWQSSVSFEIEQSGPWALSEFPRATRIDGLQVCNKPFCADKGIVSEIQE